jgi:hypothetical protein
MSVVRLETIERPQRGPSDSRRVRDLDERRISLVDEIDHGASSQIDDDVIILPHEVKAGAPRRYP